MGGEWSDKRFFEESIRDTKNPVLLLATVFAKDNKPWIVKPLFYKLGVLTHPWIIGKFNPFARRENSLLNMQDEQI